MEWKVKCRGCGNEFVIRFPTYELTTAGIHKRLSNIDPCYECKQELAGFDLVEILVGPGCSKT